MIFTIKNQADKELTLRTINPENLLFDRAKLLLPRLSPKGKCQKRKISPTKVDTDLQTWNLINEKPITQ